MHFSKDIFRSWNAGLHWDSAVSFQLRKQSLGVVNTACILDKSKAGTSPTAPFICVVTEVKNTHYFFLILLSSGADLLIITGTTTFYPPNNFLGIRIMMGLRSFLKVIQLDKIRIWAQVCLIWVQAHSVSIIPHISYSRFIFIVVSDSYGKLLRQFVVKAHVMNGFLGPSYPNLWESQFMNNNWLHRCWNALNQDINREISYDQK